MCIRDSINAEYGNRGRTDMPQQTLMGFLKKGDKGGEKRPREDAAAGEGAPAGETSKSSLTEAQKAAIEEKKMEALAKRAKIVAAASESEFTSQIHPSWVEALHGEFQKPYFQKLQHFVAAERAKHPNKIFPEPQSVFSAFQHCPLDDVKVVIIGQDPYHGPKQAHGLCFSIEDSSNCKFPPSLRNVYKELEGDNDVDFSTPSPLHGNLTKWAEQGVLLLNAVMTVRKAEANSHKGQGWEKFTDAVVSAINSKKEGVVFLLWGKPAQTKGAKLNKSKHKVLTSVHPSPLSASRGWFGCQHFSKCNKILTEQGQEPINWQV
eukprot:TRINITY_DN22569_c0_g1_i1.p1 TRINITY_DN22569_c0_g1~~TRINITY_DN22569_c0_g1_i1.p1  ORF type:complete len:320 (-),score=78.61 TRINITY_DN22569_c0_g1_i1:43-1002(-)